MKRVVVRNLSLGMIVLFGLNSCNWLSEVFRPYPDERPVVPIESPAPGHGIPSPEPQDDSQQIVKPASPEPEKPKAYPIAKVVEGRPGHVLNPYTGNLVDVTGIPSGKLVYDPADPDKEKHYFRVP